MKTNWIKVEKILAVWNVLCVYLWGKVFKNGPAFKKFEGVWSAGRPHSFKFFKGCLPQILPGPFLNTLSHIWSISICQFT